MLLLMLAIADDVRKSSTTAIDLHAAWVSGSAPTNTPCICVTHRYNVSVHQSNGGVKEEESDAPRSQNESNTEWLSHSGIMLPEQVHYSCVSVCMCAMYNSMYQKPKASHVDTQTWFSINWLNSSFLLRASFSHYLNLCGYHGRQTLPFYCLQNNGSHCCCRGCCHSLLDMLAECSNPKMDVVCEEANNEYRDHDHGWW